MENKEVLFLNEEQLKKAEKVSLEDLGIEISTSEIELAKQGYPEILIDINRKDV